MKRNIQFSAGLGAGAILSLVVSGCLVPGPAASRGYRQPQVHTAVIFQDDYDYYPAYGVYYSRNRHEYVYRNGSSWVRGPQPEGVSLNVLLAAPAVRMAFHDSPEQHHNEVARSYPKNWRRPVEAKAHRKSGPTDNKHEKKNESKGKQDDRRHDDRASN